MLLGTGSSSKMGLAPDKVALQLANIIPKDQSFIVEMHSEVVILTWMRDLRLHERKYYFLALIKEFEFLYGHIPPIL